MDSINFEKIISVENILLAWKEFLRGKRNKKDVQEFQLHLMDNILSLHDDLKNRTYVHGGYHAFNISDPKPRNIHKASVRDRLLHHAVYRILYPYFDKKFISDSYSCRINKGTHKAINRFRDFSRKVSKNNTKTYWVLKCDIRKFFASIDHNILKKILEKHIKDKNILWLLSRVIDSFETQKHIYAMADICKVGLPLGNLTSQLLVNVYMNEFDQFMKRELKVKYYIRYADDFVILSENKNYLEELLPNIYDFLEKELKLELHPDKVFIKTLASGVDFLGWVHFPKHRVLRTSTKKKMFRNLENNFKEESQQSYLGLLSHGNAHKLEEKIIG
ncbi:MAG: reverse transcriptase domain-containing protein [Candidatus Berkelbacteria bacterium]|nr:reverse transcriptase domain-containing protein [Candidatus Berkelbacteria bacterium]